MSRVYEGPAIRAIYRQLVTDFGGVEAAASFFGCSKGTISKECSGDAAIPPHHFAALEDELGRWPITDLLATRRERRSGQGEVAVLAAQVMRETGDVGHALVQLLTGGDTSAAMKEVPEAMEAMAQFMAFVERAE